MTEIISNTAASVEIMKLPDFTQYVSCKITNRELTLYYWLKDVVCKYDFYDPQKRGLDFWTISQYSGLQGYRDAFYPCSGDSSVIQKSLEQVKKYNLKNIVFNCLAVAHVSIQTGKLTDHVHFYGVNFRPSKKDKNILLATKRYRLPNTSSGRVCWGNRTDTGRDVRIFSHGTPAGKINTFLNTTFNNDYVSLATWMESIEAFKLRKCTSQSNFGSTLILNCDETEDNYTALLRISVKQNPVAYFRLYAAGYRPISDSTGLMLIPMKSGSVTYDETEYFGYLTKSDALGKSWFVNETGHLLGQVDG